MTRVQQSGTGGPRLRRLWFSSPAWSVLVWSGTGLHTAAARDKPCAVTVGNEQVTIAVPPEMPDKIDTVVVLQIQGDPQVSRAQ